MIKVLFVCLGNICRSPMAEAMFRELVRKKGLDDQIFVDSAGTGNWHIGEPPHKGTIEILSKNNINVEGLKARQIQPQDLEEFDYIIAMDADNRKNIENIKAAYPKADVSLLLEHVPKIQDINVPDPYFTGNFIEVYELVEKGCEALLSKIIAEQF